MIKITKTKSGFKVEGHAGYAPMGDDIVCAAISAILQGFVQSVDELTECDIKYSLKPGFAKIEIKDTTEAAQLLMESFFIGCQLVADSYPAYVQVTKP